jgi:hypothetical protein
MNDEGEEDTARRAENIFRKANSFSTIEIVDEAERFAFARFIIFVVHEEGKLLKAFRSQLVNL